MLPKPNPNRSVVWDYAWVFAIAALVYGFALIILIGWMLLFAHYTAAKAQHNHEAGHNEYQGWASQVRENCCNNQDCGALNADEVRETSAGAEVKIAGQWCPVEQRHYIVKGRSPDWSRAHACVGNSEYWKSQPPCTRLFCYSAPGGF